MGCEALSAAALARDPLLTEREAGPVTRAGAGTDARDPAVTRTPGLFQPGGAGQRPAIFTNLLPPYTGFFTPVLLHWYVVESIPLLEHAPAGAIPCSAACQSHPPPKTQQWPEGPEWREHVKPTRA
jgi:hypothetical protein